MNVSKEDKEELREAKAILTRFCHKYYKDKKLKEEINVLFQAKFMITDTIITLDIKDAKK